MTLQRKGAPQGNGATFQDPSNNEPDNQQDTSKSRQEGVACTAGKWRFALIGPFWAESCDHDHAKTTLQAVALVLSVRINNKTNSAHPSLKRIAADSGKKKSMVDAALKCLADRGWLSIVSNGGPVPAGGGRRPNLYSPTIPAYLATTMGVIHPTKPSEAINPTETDDGGHRAEVGLGIVPDDGGHTPNWNNDDFKEEQQQHTEAPVADASIPEMALDLARAATGRKGTVGAYAKGIENNWSDRSYEDWQRLRVKQLADEERQRRIDYANSDEGRAENRAEQDRIEQEHQREAEKRQAAIDGCHHCNETGRFPDRPWPCPHDGTKVQTVDEMEWLR